VSTPSLHSMLFFSLMICKLILQNLNFFISLKWRFFFFLTIKGHLRSKLWVSKNFWFALTPTHFSLLKTKFYLFYIFFNFFSWVFGFCNKFFRKGNENLVHHYDEPWNSMPHVLTMLIIIRHKCRKMKHSRELMFRVLGSFQWKIFTLKWLFWFFFCFFGGQR
jgi:hypothetical protein